MYTIEEAIARIAFEDGDVGGDFEAEIVVTRQVAGGEETVIAAMTEIEVITINGTNVAGNGTAGNEMFEIYGNFDTTTSLRPNNSEERRGEKGGVRTVSTWWSPIQ